MRRASPRETSPRRAGYRAKSVAFGAVVTGVVVAVLLSGAIGPVSAGVDAELDLEVPGDGSESLLTTQYLREGVVFGDAVGFRGSRYAPRVGVLTCPSAACGSARSGSSVAAPLGEDVDATARVLVEFAEPQNEVELFVGLPPGQTEPVVLELVGYDAKGDVVARDRAEVRPPARALEAAEPATEGTTPADGVRTPSPSLDGTSGTLVRDRPANPVVATPDPSISVVEGVFERPAFETVRDGVVARPPQVRVTYETAWSSLRIAEAGNRVSRVDVAVAEEGVFVPFLVDDVSFGRDAPPTAAFSPNVGRPTAGDTVTFDASRSTDDVGIAEYWWDLRGNGTFVRGGQVASHTFDEAGPHGVALRVVDGSGQTATANATVSVNGRPTPVVEPALETVSVGETVTFDASESTDDGAVLGYRWAILRGTTVREDAGRTTTYTFEDPGTYEVRLTVVDDEQTTATVSVAVEAVDDGPQSVDPAESGSAAESPDVPTAEPPTDTDAPAAEAPADADPAIGGGPATPTDTTPVPPNEVTPSTDAELDAPTSRPPDASLDAAFDWRPTEPSVGRTVTFDASATAVPEGSEPSYAWRFGDGLTFEGPVVERTFETDDPQTVTLNVSLGATTFSTATATVRPTRGDPPTARIDPSASELPLGEPVRFDGRRSTDEDGEIVTYAWTFSDGDQREGPSVARTFEAGSTVTVALTVTDDRGLSHTATTTYALGSQAAAVGPSPPPVPVEVVGLVVGATAAVFTFAGAVGSGVPPPPPSPPGPGFDAPRGERRNERSEGRDDRRRYRPPLRITRVRPSRSDPDSEFVELHNPTETPLSLGGAVVEGAGVVYEFEDGARIGADERLALYTGRGTDAPDGSVRYGGSAVSVLDAGVGCVTVRRGSVALGRRTYVGSVGRVRDALGR